MNEKSLTSIPALEKGLGSVKGILSLLAVSVGLVKKFPWKGDRSCIL